MVFHFSVSFFLTSALLSEVRLSCFACPSYVTFFFAMQVHPPLQQEKPLIGYKSNRTKGIISRGKRPSDIDSNASAPDDDLEIEHTTQEEESKPKRQKTGENEVKYACKLVAQSIFLAAALGG